MKFLVVLAVAVACVGADVSHLDAAAEVLKYESDISPEGQFKYSFETSNGIHNTAEGVLNNVNAENPALAVTGEYSYNGDDGQVYSLKYVADENGYQPQGAHLPVAPPIPELILRSIQYNAAHPQAQVDNKNENYQRAAYTPPKPAAPLNKFNKKF